MTRARVLLASASLLVLLAACETGNQPSRAPMAAEPNRIEPLRIERDRVVIKRAEQGVEVREIAPAVDAARLAATDSGGYVESETRSSDEQATVVLRIAAASLDATLARIAALGTEKWRSVSSEDVTESHADLETRLRNQEALRDRLRGLAASAKTVAEVLSVETELARVQSEIEVMQAQLARMKRDVSLTSLSVQFERARIYGPLGYFFRAIGWGIERLFVIR